MCIDLQCPKCDAVKGPEKGDRLLDGRRPDRVKCRFAGTKRCTVNTSWSNRLKDIQCLDCRDERVRAQRRESTAKYRAQKADNSEWQELQLENKRQNRRKHREQEKEVEKDPELLNQKAQEARDIPAIFQHRAEKGRRYAENKKKRNKGTDQTARSPSVSSEFKEMKLATAGGPQRITQPSTQRDDRDTSKHQKLDFILGSSSSSRSNSSSSGEEERPRGREKRQSRPSAPFSQRSSDDPNRRQGNAGGPSQTIDIGGQRSHYPSQGPQGLYIPEGPMGQATFDGRPANLIDIQNELRRQQGASDNSRPRRGDGAPSYGEQPARHTSYFPYDPTSIQEEPISPSRGSRQRYAEPSSIAGYGRQDERSRDFQEPEYDQGVAPPGYSSAPQPPVTGRPRSSHNPSRSSRSPPPKYSKYDTSRGGRRY